MGRAHLAWILGALLVAGGCGNGSTDRSTSHAGGRDGAVSASGAQGAGGSAAGGASTGTGGGTPATGGATSAGGTSTGTGGVAAGTGGGAGHDVCATANENSSATLACESGEVIDAIVFASFGTPSGTCGSFATSACNSASSTSVVESICLGHRTCTVAATNAAFGDPCSGTYKRLSVEAHCTSGTDGTGGTGGTATGGTGGTATGGTGGTATGGTGGTGGSTGKVFSQCRFHFGTIDSRARNIAGLAAQLDFFTPGWMGQRDTFDMQYVCDEANPGKQLANLVPVIVSYVIAFTARRDENLQDCNVSSSNNLCNYGATYIRAHTDDRILPIYRAYAQGFANCWGTTRPIVFEMEPDYYQYSAGGDPNALTPTEAGALMTRMVNTMKQVLPNALFSLDISPWIPNNGRDWYSHFDLGLFTFINTSGGGTAANNTRIRANNSMTWAGVHQVTGKPILADTGYGVAGTSAGEDPAWNVPANINARIADGVISISQYNPTSSWPTTISQIRSQLVTPPYCP